MGQMEVEIKANRISELADKSSLAGSATDMTTIKQNLIKHIGLNIQQVAQMTSLNPKRAIGLI